MSTLPRSPHARELARERVIAAAASSPTPQALFAVVSEALGALVPSDASGWFGVDPNSLLPTWPSRVENIPPGNCEVYWRCEYHEDDVLRLAELAVGDRSTGAIRDELAGLVNRSARFRDFLEPLGFADELRSAWRTGDSTWGMIVLLRRSSSPPFGADEIDFVAELSQPLAEVLRMKVLSGRADESGGHGAGVLSYDLDGKLLAANDDALYWLDQLPNSEISEWAPTAVTTTLAHARAVEAGRAHGPVSTLLASRSGRWLSARASALRGVSGEPRSFAVTIEPAGRSDLAPLLAEAYGLSRRELEVTQRLARGEATSAIAEALYLSEHTVRDHVKSVLAKTGVSSRAALVAHLFFGHVRPEMERDAIHL